MLALYFKNADRTYTEVTADTPLPVTASVTFDTTGLATSALQTTANDALAAMVDDLDAMRNDTSSLPVIGEIAADAAVSTTKPVLVGGRVSSAIPTAMSADGDAVHVWLDARGRVMTGGAPRARIGRVGITITSSTAETDLITAGAANVFRDVNLLLIANNSVSACKVTIRDVAAGGTPMIFAVPAGQTVGFSVAVDSAALQGTAASKWTATCGSSVDNVTVTAQYVERQA